MKKYFILSTFSFLILLPAYGQEVDSIASSTFENWLEVIQNRLENKQAYNVVSTVALLSLLTGIPSESDVNYAGQMSPTLNDYKKWYRWYVLNKLNLYWDNSLKAVMVSRRSNIPALPDAGKLSKGINFLEKPATPLFH